MISNGAATNIDPTKKVALTTTMEDLGIAVQTIKIKAINKDGGFDKEPYTLDIKGTDTLESVISKINADSGVNVFFDEEKQKFSIQAKNTGVPKDDPATIEDESTQAAIQLEGTFLHRA